MSTPPCFASVLAFGLSCLIALALGIGSAHAAPPTSFGSGQLGNPIGVAVDQSSHDVYVGNLLGVNNDKYDASGNLISPPSPFGAGSGLYSGVAVNPTNGDVYVVDAGAQAIDTYDPSSGALLSSFPVSGSGNLFGSFTAVQIASDPGGNVYVPNAPHNEVQVFSSTGAAPSGVVATITGSGANVLSGPTGVAVDAAGHVWVADTGNGRIEEFDASGAFIASIASPGVQAVALDGAGQVFAAVYNGIDACGSLSSPCYHVVEYTAAGVQIADFGAGAIGASPYASFGGIATLAVDDASGTVYIADGANNVIWAFTQSRPAVDAEYSSSVTSSSATLGAQVDPDAANTTYHFEYGTDSSYGTSIPVSDAAIGSGTSDQAVAQHVQGLQADTTYHYRVVATNALGTTDGPDHTFTTQALGVPFALPDNRAYELVSPVDKNGTDAASNGVFGWQAVAAVSGDAITYGATGNGFAGASGDCVVGTYLSRRTLSGWTTQAISPPVAAEKTNGYGGCLLTEYPGAYFTSDLSKGLVLHADPPLTSEAPAGEINLYVANLAEPANPSYQLVTPVVPPLNPPYTFISEDSPRDFTVPSADLSHVVFVQPDALTPNAPGGGVPNTYEWAGGKLRLVNIAPDGSVLTSGGTPGNGLPDPAGNVYNIQTHAVSADGSRIFFTSPADQSSNTRVYVRENGTTTIEVSASQRSTPDPAGSQPKQFLGANADGSKVLLASCEKLTNDSTAVAVGANCGDDTEGRGEGKDLYQYDVDTGKLTDLSVDHSAGDPLGADLLGVVGSSEDGSYVYFVAEGNLAAGATSGQPNLYLYHGGTTTFIATLVAGSGGSGDSSLWNLAAVFTPARVTPDGTHLAFVSSGRLTGYDNTDAASGQPDYEVYLYDAVSNQLRCVSCNPTGARPVGSSSLGEPGSENHTPHNLSDDGSRLFFESGDALVPGASSGVTEVYEYEDGHVYLLSPGTATGLLQEHGTSAGAAFLDASPSGNDVFIATRDRLLPQDTDDLVDVYDVRVCTAAEPCIAPPPPSSSSSCAGDSCRGALGGSPSLEAPASIVFSGPGNVGPAAAGRHATRFKIIGRVVHGTAITLAVTVPGGGQITISGAGVLRARRTVAGVGSYRLTVTLTSEARNTLHRKRRLKLRLHVGYVSANGAASSVTASLTVKA